MPQEKKITLNSFSSITKENNEVFIGIDAKNDGTLKTNILDKNKQEDSVNGLEGELIVLFNNNTNYIVNINGELIISHNEIENYAINNNGELEYSR